HYEKPDISDVNYLKGTLIPFGTRVQVLEVRKNSVKFQPAGHPTITLVLRYGKEAITMDQYLDRTFVREDPHTKLPRPGKDKKQAAADVPAQRRCDGAPAPSPPSRRLRAGGGMRRRVAPRGRLAARRVPAWLAISADGGAHVR